MRLILLILLLVVAANGGIFDSLSKKVKGVFTGEGSFGQKLKNATLTKLRKLFNNTAVLKIRDKFKSLKSKMLKALQLTPQMMKSLKERLQKLKPIKHNKVKEAGDSIEEINGKKGVGEALFQRDIALTEDQADDIFAEIEGKASNATRIKRQMNKDRFFPRRLWSKGMFYYFDKTASEKMKKAFKMGAKLWSENSCIDIIEDKSGKSDDRLLVFPEDGCWSHVGRRGGIQRLSLGDGCEYVDIAAHEIGHTLGFYHTMSRHDRDDYITVNIENIEHDWLDQFTKETTSTNYNYGMEYDYGSIMHYGGTSSSLNKQPTMVPFDVYYQETLGSPFISFIDLSMLNEHYGCKGLCDKAKSVTCEMGGFPNPRNCSRCICPGGYGGDRCTERPDGCGMTIEASPAYKRLTNTLGDGSGMKDDFEKCHYWIQSPPRTQIEVRLIGFTTKGAKGVAVDGCTYAGVEIKTNENQQLTGYRFCAPEDVGTALRSQSNLVPIMTYNRAFLTEVVLEYRYVSSKKPQPKPVTTKPRPQPPVQPPTTRPTISIGEGFKCEDDPICPTLVRSGFCSMTFDPAYKMKKCPKSCKLC